MLYPFWKYIISETTPLLMEANNYIIEKNFLLLPFRTTHWFDEAQQLVRLYCPEQIVSTSNFSLDKQSLLCSPSLDRSWKTPFKTRLFCNSILVTTIDITSQNELVSLFHVGLHAHPVRGSDHWPSNWFDLTMLSTRNNRRDHIL